MRKALSVVAAVTMAIVALNVPSASAATSVTFEPRTVLGPGVPKDGTSDQNVVALGSVTFDTTATQTAQIVSSDTSTSVVLDTPYYVHHVVVPLKKTALQVNPECAPRFNAYVLVKWLSGETGAVQGVATGMTDGRRTEAKHDSDMSAVYVIPNK